MNWDKPGTNEGNMPGHNATKRVCGAKLRSRPWDHPGCKRWAVEWSIRCAQHAGPRTEAGKAKANEALVSGRKTIVEARKRKSILRDKAKDAARTWVRDFGHPASPMVIALFDPNHPTHDTVKHYAKDIIDVAKAGYK